MEDRKKIKQKKIRKRKYNKQKISSFIFFVISSLILLVLYFQFINQKKMIEQLKVNSLELQTKSSKLKDEIDRLTKEIEEVNSLEYIEKKAREELKMIKKGEKIYIENPDEYNIEETLNEEN